MPACGGLSAEWDHMVSRTQRWRKEDGERPQGRILQREGTGIPLCDYRAGSSEGEDVGETGGRADWEGPRQPRARLPGWTVGWSSQAVTKSASPPPPSPIPSLPDPVKPAGT